MIFKKSKLSKKMQKKLTLLKADEVKPFQPFAVEDGDIITGTGIGGLKAMSNGNITNYSDKNCYKLTKILPRFFKYAPIGSIIVSKETKEIKEVTKAIKKSLLTSNNGDKEVYIFADLEIEVKKYNDEFFELDDKVFNSLEELKSHIGSDFEYSIIIKKTNVSYEDELIASEFSIDVKDIQDEESKVMREIVLAFDTIESADEKEWVALVGKSGSGKTSIVEKYCELTNRELVVIQGDHQVTRADFSGFKSITTGETFITILRDAVENGKVLLIDEIDACNPNILIGLHSLKNNYFAFPDKKILIHKDFRLIATANALQETSQIYTARTPLDGATIKRFKIIEYNLTDYQLAKRFGLEAYKELKNRTANLNDLTPRDFQRFSREMKMQVKYKGSTIEEILNYKG